ncbi:MAG: hypothetical protein M3546_06510 [Actinomycetota bacterium]|nr:hypothetical protein [Actinomycetota bacterium]
MTSEFELERSPAARVLAEQALIWLVHELRDSELPIIVIGGLVPEVLAREAEVEAPAHLGTTDVDILVGFHAVLDADLQPLEEALERAGFDLDPKIAEGWRWRAKVGNVAVKVEFLCDLDDQPANQAIRLPGCKRVTAANLRGTGFVARDYVSESLTGQLPDGEFVTVKVNFAGLSGYLMAKLVAARERGKEKDYYDLTYVLLHNKAGGPHEVGQRLRDGQFGDDVRARVPLFREIAARYSGPRDVGPSGYVAQTLQIDPDAEAAILRQDAVGAMAEFIAGLGIDLT